MDPRTLLDDWLNSGALRPSSRIEYEREVTRWITWCTSQYPPVDPYQVSIEDIAAWCAGYLTEVLDGRLFDGPDALAHIADHYPAAAMTHDRRITALTQYYEACKTRGAIRLVPDLTMLRSGVDRDANPPRRLTPTERAVLFTCIGMWGPDHARQYLRDRLVAFLLLEGLRPAEVTRVDMRHLYDLEDGTWEVRAPDYEYEAVGKKHILEPLTVAALRAYLPQRPRPADGVHAVVLGQTGRPITTDYPNKLVRQICSTHELLARRDPPVTADAIAHTGYWDTPAGG
ncbi:tyrosine-type recombinase/integrase [Streptomyces sp. NPDC005548]|uniref:tyrosine-type recombinase/integrase n=1 Tax=Streptomyces sp. NPDC005548 TaxID=3364724 RepID=UPI0036C4D65A